MAKKQTSIYLSERDYKILDKLKEHYNIASNGEIIRFLINSEYKNVIRYTTIK